MSEGLSTKDFKILISGLLSRAKSFYTEREYWRVIIWSLQILWDGYYPLYNWDGGEYAVGTPERARAGFPIAGRLFAVVWNLKADMDHIGSKWRLEHASAKQMCPWCEANLGGDDPEDTYDAELDVAEAPWNDIADDAVWRGTQTVVVRILYVLGKGVFRIIETTT